MSECRFYACKKCDTLVGMIHDGGAPLFCCGEEMTELAPGSVEASTEKHLPLVKVEKDRVYVDVGSAAHPMTSDHLIEWVYLQTDRGGQRKCLKPDSEPKVVFALCDEKPAAVYAYCNLHGLWRTEL